MKLGQVEVGSNIAQNHSSSLSEIISGHYLQNSHEKLTKYEIRSLLFAPIWFYLPLFGPKIPYMSIFSLIYQHSLLFTNIWSYVALINLNLSYLPLITLI